ncbi:DUF6234 family protein [Streptomyces sp. NPDC002690]
MPNPPATDWQPSPVIRGCADATVAVLAIALELVICLLIALQRALSHRSDDLRRQERRYDGTSTVPVEPPPMGWGSTVVFGVITVVVALVAVSLIRGGWPGTGWTQLLAAFVLVFVTLSVAEGDYDRAHPATTGTGAAGASSAHAAAPPPRGQT